MLASSFANVAHAQGPGLYIAKAGTGRPACTSITGPVPGATWCHDGNDLTLKVWNGTSYVGGTSGGIPSLNGLTGALAIQGTPNQVLVSALGSTIGLSLPQSIGLSSSPSFAGLTLSGIAPASTECLQISTLGVIGTSGATCGGGGGAGVSAINSATGGLTLVGVANRTTVTTVGTTLTVTLPNAVSGLTSLSVTGLLSGPMFVTDKGGQVYNVKTAGAVCDGVTDDRAALNTLANTTITSTTTGDILFPAGGACVIGSNMTFPPNVRLVFDPHGTIRLASGVVVPIQGAVADTQYQIFANANAVAGQGVIIFIGNSKVRVRPEWWGAVGYPTLAEAKVGTDATAPVNAALGQLPLGVGVRGSRAVYRVGNLVIPDTATVTRASYTIEGAGAGDLLGSANASDPPMGGTIFYCFKVDGTHCLSYAPANNVGGALNLISFEMVGPDCYQTQEVGCGAGATALSGDGIHITGQGLSGATPINIRDVAVNHFLGGNGLYATTSQNGSFHNFTANRNKYGFTLESAANANNFYAYVGQYNTHAAARFIDVTTIGMFGGLFQLNDRNGLYLEGVNDFVLLNGHFEGNNTTAPNTFYALHIKGTAGRQNNHITCSVCRFAAPTDRVYLQGVATGETYNVHFLNNRSFATGNSATIADAFSAYTYFQGLFGGTISDSGTGTRYDVDGRIGLGGDTQSVPGTPLLLVRGDSQPRMTIDGPAATSVGVNLSAAGTSIWGFVRNATTNTFAITQPGSNEFQITTAGNVGLGTISPAAKLDARGSGIFSLNTATLPAMPSGGVLQISNVNANPAYVTLDTFGNQSGVLFRRANGTPGSRTALVAGDLIGGLVGLGAYDATNYTDPSTGGNAGVGFYAAGIGAWTSGSRPTRISFGTTPSGSATILDRMEISDTGSVTIGTGSWWVLDNTNFGISTTKTALNSTAPYRITSTTTGPRSGFGSVTIPPLAYGAGGPGELTYATGLVITDNDSTNWPDGINSPGFGTINNAAGSSALIVTKNLGTNYSGIGLSVLLQSTDTRNPVSSAPTCGGAAAGGGNFFCTNIEQDQSNLWSLMVGNAGGAGTNPVISSQNFLLLSTRLSAVNVLTGIKIANSNFINDRNSVGLIVGAGDGVNVGTEYMGGSAYLAEAFHQNQVLLLQSYEYGYAVYNNLTCTAPNVPAGCSANRWAVRMDGSTIVNMPNGANPLLDLRITDTIHAQIDNNSSASETGLLLRENGALSRVHITNCAVGNPVTGTVRCLYVD